MRNRRWNPLPALAGGVALLLAAVGCSNERTVYSLTVAASPNPAVASEDDGGRRWTYTITIQNPNAVGIVLEHYNHEITGTDSGYSQPLLGEEDWPLSGVWVPPGQSRAYEASRFSEGLFSSGTERRIYHGRGDDGRYHSGEVVISLP